MEKQAAAYHEIGHFARAIRAHNDAALSAMIQPSNQGWGGDTQVKKSFLSDDELCSVALAGFLAEGMGTAKRGKDAPGLAFHPQLAVDVLRCIEQNFPHGHDDDVWPIQVPLDNGETRQANLTKADIGEIPVGHRTEPHISNGLKDAIAFLNAKRFPIDILADFLVSKEFIVGNAFFNWLFRQ